MEHTEVPTRDRDQTGFTLLETLQSLGIGLIILAGLSHFMLDLHRVLTHVTQEIAAHQRLLTLPLLLNSLLASTGNDIDSSTALQIRTGVEVESLSDLTGSQGFPDGDVTDPFEHIQLRSLEENLQLKAGTGSFQPLSDHVVLERAEAPTPELLQLRLRILRESTSNDFPLETSLFLWNRQLLLFPEERQDE